MPYSGRAAGERPSQSTWRGQGGRSTVGARRRARGRNGRPPARTPRFLHGRPAPERRGGHIIDGTAGAGQRAVRRRGGAFARTPRGVCRRPRRLCPANAIVVSATKGLEEESLRRMSQVIEEETAASLPVVVLSGPSFAAEVASGLPAAVLAASTHPTAVTKVQEHFRGRGMRCMAATTWLGSRLAAR